MIPTNTNSKDINSIKSVCLNILIISGFIDFICFRFADDLHVSQIQVGLFITPFRFSIFIVPSNFSLNLVSDITYPVKPTTINEIERIRFKNK